MRPNFRTSVTAAAAVAAAGLGGAALAGAADNASGSSSSGSSSSTQTRPARPDRAPLSSDVAAKVKAAALKKVPGATVNRTEAGGPNGSAYHAHITTSAGKQQVVLVNSSFEATAVQADNGRGGRRGHGPGGPGRGGAGETALTGTTKEQVEAAVLAKYAGAKIDRTETNNDSTAPYESHITTQDGKELEVLVSKDFAVVDAREHPAHR